MAGRRSELKYEVDNDQKCNSKKILHNKTFNYTADSTQQN